MDKIKGALLILEDEENLQNILNILTQDLIEEIHVASNGKEGLSIVSKTPIDCAIIDIKMPQMGGLEFAREVRKQGHNFPLIIFTAFGGEENRVEALKYNIFDFVQKPDVKQLIDSIQKALNIKEDNISTVVDKYRHIIDSEE